MKIDSWYRIFWLWQVSNWCMLKLLYSLNARKMTLGWMPLAITPVLSLIILRSLAGFRTRVHIIGGTGYFPYMLGLTTLAAPYLLYQYATGDTATNFELAGKFQCITWSLGWIALVGPATVEAGQ